MNLDESSRKSVTELLMPFKTAFARYWRISWAPGLTVFALVTVFSLRLPDYFLSDVLIFIQPQKISSKIVEAPEKEEQTERFEALVQELLSRPRLRSIVDQFDLYPTLRGVVGKEMAMYKLRGDIAISPIVSPSGKSLAQTFRVEYRHSDAKMAYEVTKALSNLFIEESIITQRSETQGTEEFLDGQLRDARKRLETTEARVQQYVKANAGKLPSHREEAMARLDSAQKQLATNSSLVSANLQRMDYLQKEMSLQRQVNTTVAQAGANSASSNEAPSDANASLAQLEQSLVVLKSRYSDRHPDVVSTKKRIDMLRSRVKTGDVKSGGGVSESLIAARVDANPVTRQLRGELNELQVQTQALQKENTTLKENIEHLDSDIRSMPVKEQELIEIRRDYDNVKASYEKLLAAKEDAGLQSSLVRSQKSSQFKIVDPPSIPLVPAGPPRVFIAGGGLFAGLLVFLALPLLVFFINGSFKFRDETERDLGVAVIGVIPPMKTPAVAGFRRRATAASLLASCVSLIGGALLILVTI